MAASDGKGGKRGGGADGGKRHHGAQGATGKVKSALPSEKGTCIICGEMRTGAPAKPEFPIRAARWLRESLGQPPRHSIACGEHLAEARRRRAEFEDRQHRYGLGAILFFLLVVAGSLWFGTISAWVAVPAIAGAVFIALLPSIYYFPLFGQ